ncbi:adenylate cyclase [Geodermatophilus tzadiensis]|uniref:Adenylate cyclase n=1 Tax=Geodermatophilus tzadiensis TaxID=1137988 RepID=A0A2T0U1C7_9ACTN|nr:adenylate/guanylate cyclase domain-containing protein [Geodermatophilus tzadiensis]PRY51721.1 adenylate cyclase [Geodermatophilus tzadiensis]
MDPDGPDPAGADPRADVRDALERLLLGGPRRLTRMQVAAAAGMPPERTQRLWRALGFPDVADDDPAFTLADVGALATLSALIDSGFVDLDTEASIARATAQALSRLADWQTDMLAEVLTRQAEEHGRADAVAAAETLLPLLTRTQDYVWRRHLAANVDRLLSSGGPGDRRELAVGFADLVGYTSRSRGMDARELGAMVEAFEATATEVIARSHGRVVKTVGDGVLYTAASAVDAVEIGLTLPDAWDDDDRPRLRVGAAHGVVLTRLGDVYSPVVNLASRLCSLARPGTVLVDRALAGRLRGLPGYRVRPMRRVSVRGYDDLQPWLVRRRPPERAGSPLEDMLDEMADEVLAAPEEDDAGGQGSGGNPGDG